MKCGVRINLFSDFSVIKETLERMGIVNKREKIITPTCYLFVEDDNYYVCHFKELLAMFDDEPDELDEKDTNRRNAICTLLENWGLIEVVDKRAYQLELVEKIYILSHKDKDNYSINHKFCSFRKLAELRGN